MWQEQSKHSAGGESFLLLQFGEHVPLYCPEAPVASPTAMKPAPALTPPTTSGCLLELWADAGPSTRACAWGQWVGASRPPGTGAPFGSRIRGIRCLWGHQAGNLRKQPEAEEGPLGPGPWSRGRYPSAILPFPPAFPLALAPGCSLPVCHLRCLRCGHRAWKMPVPMGPTHPHRRPLTNLCLPLWWRPDS